MKKRGLGRGLDALLSSVASTPEPGEELREIPIPNLQPGRHQPRRAFDKESLDSLADSIKSQGVVQPIVVRPAGAGKYEIVAGERRWRAAQMAGLKTIPAVIRTLDERAAMAVALVENIQRSDLNPLEEAEALQRLIKECGLTHEHCAEAVGKSRVAVTNLLRLFELNADVQDLVRAQRLSLGHAKVLLGIGGPRQSSLAKLVVEQQLSVRQTEALVHSAAKPSKPVPRAPQPVEKELAEKIGLPVHIKQNTKGAGSLTIRFRQKADLERVVRLLR